MIDKFVATSTDVERAFWKGGLTVSRFRHSLSDKSTRASTLVGSWVDIKGIIPREHIVEVFKDKKRRLKKKQKVSKEDESDDEVEVVDG